MLFALNKYTAITVILNLTSVCKVITHIELLFMRILKIIAISTEKHYNFALVQKNYRSVVN